MTDALEPAGLEAARDAVAGLELNRASDYEIAEAAIRAYLAARSAPEAGKVVDDITAERQRQIDAEGWTFAHDDQHNNGELARAAASYALGKHTIGNIGGATIHLWPWEDFWFKATDQRRNLVKAAALIIAEIERLDRAAKG